MQNSRDIEYSDMAGNFGNIYFCDLEEWIEVHLHFSSCPTSNQAFQIVTEIKCIQERQMESLNTHSH